MTPNKFKAYPKKREQLCNKLQCGPVNDKAYQHLYFEVIVDHLVIGITQLSVLSLYKRIFTTAKIRCGETS